MPLRFAVPGVPTLLVVRDGPVIARPAGAAPLAALRSWLDGAIGGAGATEGRG